MVFRQSVFDFFLYSMILSCSWQIASWLGETLIRHYRGDDVALHFARKYSFSDRSRYYWPHPGISLAPAAGKLECSSCARFPAQSVPA
jgi:hypothetical protein